MTSKEILKFDSLNHFLKAYYEEQKQKSSKFSFEAWARKLRIKDRSHLRQILSGRRVISEDSFDQFVDFFEFKGIAKEHFSDLVKASQVKTPKLQTRYQEKIDKRVTYYREMSLIENYEKFLSNQLIPVLFNLLTFEDTAKTLSSLAQFLNQPEEQVNDWLHLLKDIQLADVKIEDKAEDKNEVWFALKKNFMVPAQIGRGALIKYHQDSLELAKKSLDQTKVQRRINSLLLTLNEKEYLDLQEKISVFISQTLENFNSDQLKERKHYRLNLGLSPFLFKG